MIKTGDILEGVININSSKSGYFTSDKLVDDLFIYKKNLFTSFNLDKVKVEVFENQKGVLEGKIIEVIERSNDEFIGKIEKTKNKIFVNLLNKNSSLKFSINYDSTSIFEDDQVVIVKLTKWTNPKKNPIGEIIKVIGKSGEHETEIHTILEQYNLPYEFPQEVINESELISEIITQKEIDSRLDMRNVFTCTIDGSDAKDLDDALSVQWVNGNIQVGVHIADVTHYVKTGTLLDKEAMNRSTSIYLVDRTIPMLPERLSNNLCSLNPHTDKLVYSFLFTLDQNGKVINEEFKKGIINSNHRLTYDEVQKVIEGGETHSEELKRVLLDLNKYAKKLRKHRTKNNTLKFKGTEIKFKLDENNKPVDLFFREQKDANWLIEDFMVLTNMKVCEFIAKKGLKSIHRTHDKPNPEKLESLKSFVESMGYNLDLREEEDIKNQLNKLLKQVEGTSEENIINNLVVRCMSKANYQSLNIGHYGLGLQHYVHVTSPIRRACDVLVHRQLTEIIYNDKTDTKQFYKNLDSQSAIISSREKTAAKAERESVKYMQCIYLSERIGKVYKAIISSVTDYGMFITIPENGCDGFVKSTNLEGDRFMPDTKNHCIKGVNTGLTYRLGDDVNVIVSSVDVPNKFINLSIINLL